MNKTEFASGTPANEIRAEMGEPIIGSGSERLYRQITTSPDGGFLITETNQRPQLAGNLAEETYGDLSCSRSTVRHLDDYREIGKMPNLIYLDSAKTAAALGLSPCEHCWVTGEHSVSRWQEYLDTCDVLFSPDESKKFAELIAKNRFKQKETFSLLGPVVGRLPKIKDETEWKRASRTFVRLLPDLWEGISGKTGKMKIEKLAIDIVLEAKNRDPVHAAELFISFREVLRNQRMNGELDAGTDVPVGELMRPAKYLRDLLQILPAESFSSMGTILQRKLSEFTSLTGEEIFVNISATNGTAEIMRYPVIVREKMIDCFVEAGLLTKGKRGKLSLTKRAIDMNGLRFEDLQTALMASDLLQTPESAPGQIKTFADVQRRLAQFREKAKMPELQFKVKDDGVKILYISELLWGHKDTGDQFVAKLLDALRALPADEKPDIVVLSGLIQGGFQHRQTNRRAALAIESVNEQFQAAKVFLDELKTTGIKNIVINLGDDDREVCVNYTIEALRMLQHLSQPQKDTDKSHVTYYQINKLKQTRAWDVHYRFQFDVVLPYCIRSGRRLLSADEVEKKTGGKLRMEEYLMLWETYYSRQDGKTSLPNPLYGEVLESEYIPTPGHEFKDFTITDDAVLRIKTEESDYTQWIKHNLAFSFAPMYQNPTVAAEALMKQLAARGDTDLPDALVLQHQQIALGLGGGDRWILSTPGMLLPEPRQRGSIGSVQGDASWRLMTTRRNFPVPAAMNTEMTDDHRMLVSMYTDRFLEKSTISPDRVTVVNFNDWQVGSPSARLDLQVKFAHMAFRKLLHEGPVVINFAGDIIQATNFKSHVFEDTRAQQIAIDSQVRYVDEVLRLIMEDVPKEDAKNLLMVRIIPGNHEWNSGFPLSGSVHTHHLTALAKDFYQSRGEKAVNDKVRFCDTIASGKGDVFNYWMSYEPNVGGYGLMVQHIILAHGAASGNRAPVWQAQDLLAGLGGLAANIDITYHGHWHHPMFGLFGNTLSVVGTSLAGMTGYEYSRGLKATPGATLIRLGGGRVPVVEFLSAETLYGYDIKSGYFSDRSLAKRGLGDDEHFDPARHAFMDRQAPKSALQKELWRIIDSQTNEIQSSLS